MNEETIPAVKMEEPKPVVEIAEKPAKPEKKPKPAAAPKTPAAPKAATGKGRDVTEKIAAPNSSLAKKK